MMRNWEVSLRSIKMIMSFLFIALSAGIGIGNI
jgi:hypothetical protein